MAANWSEIPEELVYLVGERVVRVDDMVRFGAVCKSWRSVSILKKKQPFAPLIMLAKADNDDDQGKQGIRTFIIPYGGKGQQDKMTSFNLELPKAQGTRCWGSPYSWVVTIGLDHNIHLLNPLTGVQHSLPPNINLQLQSNEGILISPPANLIQTFTSKFVVGWNPSSSLSSKGELIVMAIFGIYLEVAFTTTCILPENRIEASSSSWRLVQTPSSSVADLIFFEGMIFIIDLEGNLSVCDINKAPLNAIPVVGIADIIENALPQAIQVESIPRYYLIYICGRLHLVARFYQRFDGRSKVNCYSQTKCFQVYRFNFREIKWYHVPELGEYALFVGNHSSFSISNTTYPEFSSNCIYFTDDFYEGYESPYCDAGVFNYKEGTIQKFDFTNHGAFSKSSRPIFFMPAL